MIDRTSHEAFTKVALARGSATVAVTKFSIDVSFVHSLVSFNWEAAAPRLPALAGGLPTPRPPALTWEALPPDPTGTEEKLASGAKSITISAKISDFREKLGFSRKSRIFAKFSYFREQIGFLRKLQIFAKIWLDFKSSSQFNF